MTGGRAISILRIALLLLVGFIDVPPADGLSLPGWRDQLSEAESLSMAQQQDSAIAIISGALESLDPAAAESDTARARLTYLLSECHSRKQNYVQAERLRRRAVDLYRALYGDQHALAGACLSNLGLLQRRLGRFIDAEQSQRQAIEILQSCQPPEPGRLAWAVNNLAAQYYFQGRFTRAIPLFQHAIDVSLKSDKPDRRWTWFCRSNLADVYREVGRYGEAEKLFDSVLTVFGNMVSADYDPMRHARTLHDLALVYLEQGRAGKAAQKLQEALSVSQSVFTRDHPALAVYLHSLGRAQAALGNLDSAEVLLSQALELRSTALGEENYATAAVRQDLSRVIRLSGDVSRALPMAKRAATALHTAFEQNAGALSEQEALAYSDYYRSALDNLITCFVAGPVVAASDTQAVVEALLQGKGRVAEIMTNRLRAPSRYDEQSENLVAALRAARHELSALLVGESAGNERTVSSRADSLTRSIENSEAGLSIHLAGLGVTDTGRDLSLGDITHAIPDDALLIDYLRYEAGWRPESGEDAGYVAVCIGRDTGWRVQGLGSADVIDSLIGAYREHMTMLAERPYMPTLDDLRNYVEIAGALYRCLLEPFESKMGNNRALLVAPDAALNLIPFAALPTGAGRYVIEDHTVHYLTAGREVAQPDNKVEVGSGLLAIGDPDFDALPPERTSLNVGRKPASPAPSDSTEYNSRSGCDYFLGNDLSPLSGTSRELLNLDSVWRRVSSAGSDFLTGHAASEELFKQLAPKRQVIHLATHGYYLANACRQSNSGRAPLSDVLMSRNPLLRSGLFLAGANLRGRGGVSDGAEDGVLTALEVAQMELRGTELVVLSACETGLGDIEQGEGVYGLCRAFRTAGARAVVAALWPIPDATSGEIITNIYRESNRPVAARLRDAQLARLNQLRESGFADHPYQWGAFIAIGDWR